ncbi:MAG: hypothetical protein WCY91_07515 [Acidithiobacillus sp.]|jgi:hypothetical protein|uniref:Uncharacterized protein n=1 Tax=Acidithiobacillus ferruginosus TaxID=3063951 RepID=A0ACD5IK83_9PROT|nr:hypothetical protein [Acidithiobacillus ferruginosus]MBU2814284.1 hypothetical protein [Acidithiobacillus ferruginosus]MDD5004128.1 hypothetical protein [Acidithiobacillus sp.]
MQTMEEFPGDAPLRARLENWLLAGLRTEVEPRAYDLEMQQSVLTRLQNVPAEETAKRIGIAGFTLHPYAAEGIEEACETCMYFLSHRQFCALPELMLPVRPDWSCRLWRI